MKVAFLTVIEFDVPAKTIIPTTPSYGEELLDWLQEEIRQHIPLPWISIKRVAIEDNGQLNALDAHNRPV